MIGTPIKEDFIRFILSESPSVSQENHLAFASLAALDCRVYPIIMVMGLVAEYQPSRGEISVETT